MPYFAKELVTGWYNTFMKLILQQSLRAASDAMTFIFTADQTITWRAGQFIEYQLEHQNPDNRGISRWFTIASAPHENYVQLTTRISAPGSSFKRALLDLKIGDVINAHEPEGDFCVDDPAQQYVFIAGGIGITPFRSIMLDLHERNEPLNITLLYANNTPDQTVFRAEIDKLNTDHPEMDVHYVFAPDHIHESLIRDIVPVLQEPMFFVSGPEPMVETLGKSLLDMGIPRPHLKQDFFPNYSTLL